MGRVVLGVIVWSALAQSFAVADTVADDPAPTPTPAPPDINWYANTRPSTGVDTSSRHTWRSIRVNRGGLFALVGAAHMDGRVYGRLDIGTPIPTRRLPQLRVVAAISSRYGDEGTASTSDLVVAPQLQYDWRLPFGGSRGDFVIVAGAGLQRAEHWVRLPDAPYWPSKWESSSFYSYKVDVAVQFRSRNGLIVALQPFGAAVPFSKPDSPDPRIMAATPQTMYELSLSAGFQLP